MLTINFLQQTSRRLVINTSRPTFFALSYSKSSETKTKTDVTSHNYPGFYDTANVDRVDAHELKKLIKPSPKIDSSESVPSNDLLEAQRIEQIKANEKTTTPIVTSTEKFSSGLSSIQATSSITPTGDGLFHDAKVSNTPLAPGIPITPLAPGISITPLAPGITITPNVPPTTNEEYLRKDEQIPSSGFTAFLRGIRSGLPFFPSSKTRSKPVDIATTREHFIPLTRPSLIRLIATDSNLTDDKEDRVLFHELCHGFDSAVVQHYYPILNELKYLFNPLNPDNETIDGRRISYRDRLDNEYWLLQKINDLLHRANFTELPRNVLLDKFIHHEDSLLSSHINVKIDGYDYDVLKFWILGREQMSIEAKPWWKRFFKKNNQSISRDYFKRVILAVRLKGQDRLYLKAFRDIPLQNLTQLLPVGKLQMGNFEQQLIRLTFLIGAGTFVTHLITTMANYQVPGLVIGGSSLTLLFGLLSLRNYHRSKINYLSHMSQLLFYKNIASNKQLLAMIIDRAEDELSKEVLLVYMFILWKQRQNMTLTNKNLELEIENWIRSKTNTDITFNSDQSVEFLRKLGIISHDDPSRPTSLKVIPYKQVIGILPKTSRTLSEKNEEWDLIEGYDKKYFELDWKTVLNEDKLLNKTGWH
ncbi:unnamed protein product [Rotaria sordida]|uniref:Uncharacterized protein n=2 Tax=Rotaria sordida TaxID=392033 RepID=A0A814TJR3_9BILA|nr:unnamed protein product [Rotaria sordida]CAF3623284.1 unnamed protein product [Rotaria sordida]